MRAKPISCFFEVNTLDLVIEATALDGGPVHDGGSGWSRVAHVGLLKDLLEPGAGSAIGKELLRGEVCLADLIDDFQQTQVQGVFDGDAVVKIPKGVGHWSDGVME